MNDLKIGIFESLVIHIFNNLGSYIWLCLAILSHDAKEKEKLPGLNKQIKTLKNYKISIKK